MARKTHRKRKTPPKRRTITHSAVFDALTIIENTQIDLEGSAFLIEQITVHGDSLEDASRVFEHASRLLLSDVAAVRKAFNDAHAQLCGRNGGAA